jgi:micrococcal nuclease
LNCSAPAALKAVLVSLVLALAACGGSSSAGSSARVVRVVDGDTVVLSGLGKVRLIGIDTPEVYFHRDCFGEQASAYAKRVLAPGTRVSYRIGVEPRDRYGRALAYVYLEDGRMFNELLAEQGFARPLTIPPNDRFAGRFRAEARQARASGRGLWRACRAG